MTITSKDIIRIEKLARLHLPDHKVKEFTLRLSKVFDWIDQLKQVNVQGTEPLTNPLMDLIDNTPLRQDVAHPTCGAEVILSNAPDKDHGFFLVPKVVD